MADVARIAEVHLDGWQWAYHDTPLRHHLDSHPAARREEIWIELLNRHEEGARLWVAARDGAIVGFIATGPVRKLGARTAGEFELYALYQSREVARTGVAHQLVAHALSDLRHRACRSISLWALSSNQHAREFYEREGWSNVTEETMDYHGTPLVHVCYRQAL